MAHFARLDENNIVTQVLVVNNEVITVNGVESEESGVNFLTELYKHSLWKQTSYNGSFRKNYAGVGFYYDSQKDAFIPPQPSISWTLNEDACIWEPPIPYPTDGNRYSWSEENQNWQLIQ